MRCQDLRGSDDCYTAAMHGGERKDFIHARRNVLIAQHQAREGLFTCGDNGIDVRGGEAADFVDLEFIFQLQPTNSLQ